MTDKVFGRFNAVIQMWGIGNAVTYTGGGVSASFFQAGRREDRGPGEMGRVSAALTL